MRIIESAMNRGSNARRGRPSNSLPASCGEGLRGRLLAVNNGERSPHFADPRAMARRGGEAAVASEKGSVQRLRKRDVTAS